jgi:hypothetical protein
VGTLEGSGYRNKTRDENEKRSFAEPMALVRDTGDGLLHVATLPSLALTPDRNAFRSVVRDAGDGLLYVVEAGFPQATITSVTLTPDRSAFRSVLRTVVSAPNFEPRGVAVVHRFPCARNAALLRALQQEDCVGRWPPGLAEVVEMYARPQAPAIALLATDGFRDSVVRINLV